MDKLLNKWNEYWFRPGTPTVYLALTRIVAASMWLFLLLWETNRINLVQLADAPELYWPLPVLRILTLPMGWGWMPSLSITMVVYWICVASTISLLIGFRSNISAAIATIASLFTQGYLYSFGDMHHGEALMMFALMALTLSPCGRVFSVDAWLSKEKRDWKTDMSENATWPLLLIQWIMVLLYFSAGYVKLVVSGLDWMNGHTLQYYFIQEILRYGNLPISEWFAKQHFILSIMAISTIVFEIGFVLVMFYRKLLWLFVPTFFAFHIGIYITMRAPFFELMALYIVFLPWILKTLPQFKSNPQLRAF